MARWRRDGKELVFLEGSGKFLSVEVRARGDALEFGTPVLLFETKISEDAGQTYFGMSGDGQRFALHAPPDGAQMPPAERSRPLTVMTDWMAAIKR